MVNSYWAWAGFLAIFLGLVHSVLGEVLVFRRLRNNHNYSWAHQRVDLPLRSIRILWASWHLVTVFGIGFGVIMLWLAQSSAEVTKFEFLRTVMFSTTLLAGVIVFVGTRGKHPGWLVLLIISLLIRI